MGVLSVKVKDGYICPLCPDDNKRILFSLPNLFYHLKRKHNVIAITPLQAMVLNTIKELMDEGYSKIYPFMISYRIWEKKGNRKVKSYRYLASLVRGDSTHLSRREYSKSTVVSTVPTTYLKSQYHGLHT